MVKRFIRFDDESRMKPLTILRALNSLNWIGHVELPTNDLAWIADSLAAILSDSDAQRCGVCNEFKVITIETRLGRICEDCIEEASESAREAREELED